jgi:hypothetical protein
MNMLTDFVSQNQAVTAAIITSILALVGTLVGLAATIVIGRRQVAAAQRNAEAAMLTAQKVGARAIGSLRQQWIDTLRRTLSEYHSILMTAKYPLSKQDDRLVSNLGTQIELMLNPSEELSRKLDEVMGKIYECEDYDDRVAMDPEFIEAARAVLKAEWNRVKADLE